MSHVTLREQLIAGLEALGYKRPQKRLRNFDVFDRGDGRFWFVNSRGDFRTGKSARLSVPVPRAMHYYVLTAPQIRPIVFQLLDREPPKTGTDLTVAAIGLAHHSALAGIPARTILNHVNAWAKSN